MTNEDQELIKQAVELAPGWELERNAVRVNMESGFTIRQPILADRGLPQLILDALAAELVRQAECLGYNVCVQYGCIDITKDFQTIHSLGHQGDRTMNAIRSIVESGVLDNERKG